MRTHRFYLAIDNITVGEIITVDVELAHHMLKVLRLKVDDIIYIFNNSNFEYQATIVNINKKQLDIKILQAIDKTNLISNLNINLAQAISKNQKMDFAIQKAVELGVAAITPIVAEFSVVKLNAKNFENKLQHWQKIIIAACAQSGRCRLPVLHKPVKFAEFIVGNVGNLSKVGKAGNGGLILTPDIVSEKLSSKLKLSRLRDIKLDEVGCDINILIGPEGGFSEHELKLAADRSGWRAVKLGPRVLRAETAAAAAIAGLQVLFGDC